MTATSVRIAGPALALPGHLTRLGFSAGLVLCRVLALPVASACMLHAHASGSPLAATLRCCRGGPMRALHQIWFGRLAQKLVDLFCTMGWDGPIVRSLVLDRRALPAGGCIIATVHSPWDRLLARWVAANAAALVFGRQRWVRHAGAMHVRNDWRGLRRIERHLRAGGRVVMTVDAFVSSQGCEAQILGRTVHVLSSAARLAGLAHVPLVPVAARCVRGRIVVEMGAPIALGRHKREQVQATRQAIAFVDRALRDDPGIWNDLLRFARMPP